jgi:uncharacterized protein YaiI (UPF0178 family)
MTEVYVDADACPVKDEVLRVAERHGLVVHMVSNSGTNPRGNPLVRIVMVSDKFDAADDWIAERAGPGDIVVTADIPLADRCLKAGAAVLGSTGRPFTPENIGNALAGRELLQHLRETGESKGYNAGFTRQDRSRFLQAMEEAVRRAKTD